MLTHKNLVVDLDGTLIRTDILHESLVKLLFRHPLRLFSAFLTLSGGKVKFKRYLLEATIIDPATLPYNQEVLKLIAKFKESGGQIALASASRIELVESIGNHLGVFDLLIGTDEINLAGSAKADELLRRFGSKKFDYIGNAKADLKVWAVADKAFVVGGSKGLLRKASRINRTSIAVKESPSKGIWLKQLRIHQWLKNLLILAPLFASFSSLTAGLIWKEILAFLAFGFIASGTYIFNDLVDLDNDRAHHSKSNRPLAAGDIRLFHGFTMALILVAVGLVASFSLGKEFLVATLVYVATTISYSFWLKQKVIIDCIVLAFLYTLRVMAGTALIAGKTSFWLLAFSVFIFLSLAWVKRYAELEVLSISGKKSSIGRGYSIADLPLVLAFGTASSFIATLVFALYIDSSASAFLYATPEFAWLAIPVLLYWVGRLWITAHRGQMNEDPVIFAFKDRMSLISVFLIGVIMFVSHIGVPL